MVAAVSAPTSVKATLLPVLPTSVYLLVITLRACYRSFCTSCPAKRIRHYGLVKAGIAPLSLSLFPPSDRSRASHDLDSTAAKECRNRGVSCKNSLTICRRSRPRNENRAKTRKIKINSRTHYCANDLYVTSVSPRDTVRTNDNGKKNVYMYINFQQTDISLFIIRINLSHYFCYICKKIIILSYWKHISNLCTIFYLLLCS